jgi:uncharacterized membrane protein YccC
MLFYWLALSMDWDMPQYGALAIVVTSLSSSGASLNKGIMRVSGTGLGALAGFVLLAWFSQSPLAMLLAMAVYVIFIAYFLQTTRQADTWFNAGLLAVAVWSSSYMKIDTAFDLATTRFLETAAGVLLYTLVSVLFWRRTSGASLQQQGQALWEGLQVIFKHDRQQLATGTTPAGAAELRTRLAGEYQQLLATLEAAYTDTPRVRSQKRAWEILRVNLRSFGNAETLWRESIDDCRDLDMDELLPGLSTKLDILEQRLERGKRLWEEQKTIEVEDSGNDAALLAAIALEIDRPASTALAPHRQGALMNFVAQFHTLDRSSRELLQTLRVLADMDPRSRLKDCKISDPFRPSAWNPDRLLKALFPAICWVVAFAFWYYVNPPGGPAIPMMGVVFSLMLVMAPANLPGLLIVLLLSLFVAVAPVYMLLMPALDSGFGLLMLVFVYSFVFAYLGGRSPILKIGPLVMFFMLVNINNQQTYSFMALVTTALMLLLGVTVVIVVQRLLSPMHPEQILLHSVRRFLSGSARIIDSFRATSPHQQLRGRKQRRRVFETAILPIAAQLLAVEKNLDYSLFPDNTPEKVRNLIDNLQAVRLRLLSLERTCTTVESGSPQLYRSLHTFHGKWRKRIHDTLLQWSRLQPTESHITEWSQDSTFSQEMAQQLEQQLTGDIDKSALRSVYAFTGSTQSLLDAMKGLNESMKQINWHQWSVARF